jgi:hypothetical protein
MQEDMDRDQAGTGKPGVKGRGRPRVEGQRPWEKEGISRRTWERRRLKAAKAKAKPAKTR